MYIVTVENNGAETVINELYSTTNNRITGKIKQGIGTIDSFSFTIFPNNRGYNLINPMTTIVKVYNTKTDEYEFIGRVVAPTYSMNKSGLMYKSYVCESELAYLLDTQQIYKELKNTNVKSYLQYLIDFHNSNTNAAKKFTLGNVDISDEAGDACRYVQYENTKKNIEDNLIKSLGGVLRVRHENGTRFLDYIKEIGKVCDTEIRVSKNLSDITHDIDFNGYVNRVIPLGAKLKKMVQVEKKDEDGNVVKDEDGNVVYETDSDGNVKEQEVTLEERLTIAEVNNGRIYLDDNNSISKLGIFQGKQTFEDVEDANELLSKGEKFLSSQKISFSNKVTALDLSLIGLDTDSFKVGDSYPLIHEFLGINEVVQIVEKNISIEKPYENTIILGDLQKDVKKYNQKIKQGTLSELALISKKETERVNQYLEDLEKELEDVKNNTGGDTGEDSTGNFTYLFNVSGETSTVVKQSQSIGTGIMTTNIDIDLEGQSLYSMHMVPGTTNMRIYKHSISSTSSSSRTGIMTLKNFGDAKNFCIEREDAETICIWSECQSGSKICRFVFVTGTTYTSTNGMEYNLLPGHSELSPSIDVDNNHLLIRSYYDEYYYYTVFDLASVKANSPKQIVQFKSPMSNVDENLFRGHDIFGNYIYFFYESGSAYYHVIDFKGNKVISTKQIEDTPNITGTIDPTGGKFKKVTDGKYRMYYGQGYYESSSSTGYLNVCHYEAYSE